MDTAAQHTPVGPRPRSYPDPAADTTADRCSRRRPAVIEGSWAVARAACPRQRSASSTGASWCPMHRAGLAEWLGTPIGGYILVLRVRGRRSGVMRETPLSYLVAEGSIWVMAGFGSTDRVVPQSARRRDRGGAPARTAVAAIATEETDAPGRARLLPALARAAGVPGLMIGVNPWTAGDEAVLAALDCDPTRPARSRPRARSSPGGRSGRPGMGLAPGARARPDVGAVRVAVGRCRRVVDASRC